MILVDSSVWVDFFAGNASPAARRLSRALDEGEDLAVLPIIVTEVLQGFRSQREFELARKALLGVQRPPLGIETYVAAARLFRQLRARGITVRGAIDCLIAQACIEVGARLLTADAGDFRPVARYSKLRLETTGS